jgi:hypothetical protein
MWTFYLLAKNPSVEEKLVKEIDRELEGKTPGFEDLKRLSYLQKVIDEALRLFPPVVSIFLLLPLSFLLPHVLEAHSSFSSALVFILLPFFLSSFSARLPFHSSILPSLPPLLKPIDPKHAIGDDTLPDGTKIRKGMTIQWEQWVMGRHPDFWDCPEEFRPERWEGDANNGGKPLPKGNQVPVLCFLLLVRYSLFLTNFLFLIYETSSASLCSFPIWSSNMSWDSICLH